jgi:hypothetical protein
LLSIFTTPTSLPAEMLDLMPQKTQGEQETGGGENRSATTQQPQRPGRSHH